MNTMKYLSAAVCIFLLAGCTEAKAAVLTDEVRTAGTETDLTIEYTDEELNEQYDDAAASHIHLNGSEVSCEGEGVRSENGTVTITKAGTYVISGTWDSGQIIVDTEEEDIVHLVLNGVSLTSKEGPALYVRNAEETVLTVLTGTENTIRTSGENADEKKGGVYAKDDLAVNGGGTLEITAENGDGIHAGDILKLCNVILSIQAESDGIDVNDALAVKDCILTVKAEKDGLKAGDTDEETGESIPANIEISGGVITITAEDDGIQTTGNLIAVNSEMNIEAGGGYENAEPHGNEMPGGMFGGFSGNESFEDFFPQGKPGENPNSNTEQGRPGFGNRPEWNGEFPDMNGEMPDLGGMMPEMNGEMPEMPEIDGEMPEMNGMFKEEQGKDTGIQQENDEADETDASKGIKAEGSIILSGNTIAISSADDAIHADTNLTVKSGDFTIRAGDDGMHADEEMTILSGAVKMSICYEGLEAKDLTIEGGTITIAASDDGINTIDKNAETGEFQDDGSMLTINGGDVTITADGDGIDCNGSGVMNGGTVIVYGSRSGADSALDYNGTFVMNGGTMLASGSSEMAMTPSDSSKVNIIEVGITNTSGTVEVKDASGTVIAEFESEKTFDNLVIASDQIKTGSTYTITQGGETIGEVTITETITYLNRNAGNGFGGGFPGQNGGFQDENRRPDQGQRPGFDRENTEGNENSGIPEIDSETKPL